MSLFPRIQSPCPYKGKFADIMQGSQCRLCKREVIDLTDMTSGERREFLSACDTEMCISYRVGAKSALAAMAMSTVAVPGAVAAQDTGIDTRIDTGAQQAAVEDEEHPEEMWIIVGGMRKPGDAEWVEDAPLADSAGETDALNDHTPQMAEKPALPVEYDDDSEVSPEKPEDTPAK
ncbi:MAG: hypothetical protein WBA51_04505 [Erythrobacter sp.]